MAIKIFTIYDFFFVEILNQIKEKNIYIYSFKYKNASMATTICLSLLPADLKQYYNLNGLQNIMKVTFIFSKYKATEDTN